MKTTTLHHLLACFIILTLTVSRSNQKSVESILKGLFKERTYDDIFPEKTEFGRLKVTKNGSGMWYWLCRSRSAQETAPLVFWFQGGPGSSSEFGLFFENGPFYIAKQGDDTATLRPLAWNQKANMVFMDQPIATGFSKIVDEEDAPKTAEDVRNQFGAFLLEFFKEYPEFVKRDLYIAAESYGGHWAPYISNLLYKSDNPDINFKGVIMGNAWMSTATTVLNFPDFALLHKDKTKMNQTFYNEIKPQAELCANLVKMQNPYHSHGKLEVCDYVFGIILENGGFSPYDIDRQHEDEEHYINFLNRPDVQSVLGVHQQYEEFDGDVYRNFRKLDWWMNSAHYLIPMMQDESIKVWWYNGDRDFICNWLGEDDTINRIDWDGQEEWNKLEFELCEYGECKQLGSNRFIKLRGAGHMVPHDQIELSVRMLHEFLGMSN